MSRKNLYIALVGYGRMGREVEQILLERGHKIALKVDTLAQPGVQTELNSHDLQGVDGVIEFSLSAGVLSNVQKYADAGISVVLGTTGWEKDEDQLKTIIQSSKAGFLCGSNFSPGAHLFYRIVARAAQLIEELDDYDIMLHEYHHSKKADSPSGTALSTANVILQNLSRKKIIQTQALDRPILPEELHVSSTRGGNIPGIHSVRLDGSSDSISITHDARSRRGFALGSVLAMEWLSGKCGFYKVEDFFNDIFSKATTE